MAGRIREHDWAATPLGSIEIWPQSLKTAVELMLAARQPAYIAWSSQLTSFYNDAYIPILGTKHPDALGQPFAQLWAEIWGEYRPMVEATMAGDAQHLVDRPVALAGRPNLPVSWFTFSWTPLRDETGAVVGLFCAATETTDRVRAEEALRESREAALWESEKRYRTLFEAMDAGYLLADVIFDETGRAIDMEYVEANPAAIRMVGTDPTGRRLSEISPGYEPYWYEIWGRVACSGTGERLERYAAPEGRCYDFHIFKPEPSNEESRRVAVMFRDVTAEKKAEAALRDREERLRHIVENARDYAIFLTDNDGRITDWYGGAERVFGWNAAEVVGQPGAILFTPEDRAAGVPEQEIEIARQCGVAPDIRWHVRKDGSRVFIEGSRTALRNPDGSQRGFLKIGQDVTERRAAEQRLARNEALFRTLATGIQQLVFLSGPDGFRTWGSPQWVEYTGLSFEESLGFGWLEAVHPDDRGMTLQGWTGIAAAGDYYVEHRIRRARDGIYRWHQTRARPLDPRDAAGSEWVGASTEVHDLRELREMQGVLVAELQHRTRNLIGVVRSVADRTLASSASLDDFRNRFRDRLAALTRVQGLLSGRDAGQKVTFDELIRAELLGLGAVDANGEGLQVTLEGPKGVRLRSTTLQTFALALHELGTNAVKYGALSRPEGRLAVRWSVEDGADEKRPRLRVEWLESGAPVSAEAGDTPPRIGFGRELIERALPYQLSAETAYEIRPDGVRCFITVPISPP